MSGEESASEQRDLVLMGMKMTVFHRRWHSAGPSCSWTREYAEECGARPCKVCYRTTENADSGQPS